jgi:hypothetical protein
MTDTTKFNPSEEQTVAGRGWTLVAADAEGGSFRAERLWRNRHIDETGATIDELLARIDARESYIRSVSGGA